MAIAESAAVASIIGKLLSMSTDLIERKESREGLPDSSFRDGLRKVAARKMKPPFSWRALKGMALLVQQPAALYPPSKRRLTTNNCPG